MVRVLLFGRLADVAGWRERAVEAGSIAELRRALARTDPELDAALDGPGVQVAIDKAIVRGEAALVKETEVAFLPPMSGG